MIAERNASKLTIVSYNTDFEAFYSFLVASGIATDITKITTTNIRSYTSHLSREKHYCTATIRRKIHSLSSFFKFLVSQEYLIKSPMPPIMAPKRPDNILIYLQEAELKKLICMPRLHSRDNKLRDTCILQTFIFTGVRRSELLALDWSDIDFQQNTIKVRHGKPTSNGTSPSQSHWYLTFGIICSHGCH